MKKDDWTIKFVNEVVLRLRKDLSPKFARAIAANEWPQNKDVDPRDAAKQWVKRESEEKKPRA